MDGHANIARPILSNTGAARNASPPLATEDFTPPKPIQYRKLCAERWSFLSPLGVLLMGDSEMEQYYLRIDWLLMNHPLDAKRIVYATHGGCPPVQYVRENHLPWCNGLVERNIKLSEDPTIDTIVIAADWTGYFIARCLPRFGLITMNTTEHAATCGDSRDRRPPTRRSQASSG